MPYSTGQMLDKVERLEQQLLQSCCISQHVPSRIRAVCHCARAASIPALLFENGGCTDKVTEASLKLVYRIHGPYITRAVYCSK